MPLNNASAFNYILNYPEHLCIVVEEPGDAVLVPILDEVTLGMRGTKREQVVRGQDQATCNTEVKRGVAGKEVAKKW